MTLMMSTTLANRIADDLAHGMKERRHFEAERGDDHGRLRFMARADGYVMVRRPGAAPYCITEKDWLALPTWSKPRA